MIDLDERIRQAREAVRRHERLTKQRMELEQHLHAVGARLAATEQAFAKEHQDVVRLEQSQFQLNPKQLQQLDRERWEATAAHEQMEGERGRMNQLLADRDRMDAELAQLARAKDDLEQARQEKREQLRQAGDTRGLELDDVTERLTHAEIALREHVEALNAGRAAGPPLGALQKEFGGASTWSKVDMFGGGGWAKRAHLETAAQIAWEAQRQLDLFGRELADLGIQAAPQLPVIQTDFFTDILFDNIFTDIKRNDQINQAITQIDGVGRWLHDTVQWLDGRCFEIDRDVQSLRSRRDTLLAAAPPTGTGPAGGGAPGRGEVPAGDGSAGGEAPGGGRGPAGGDASPGGQVPAGGGAPSSSAPASPAGNQPSVGGGQPPVDHGRQAPGGPTSSTGPHPAARPPAPAGPGPAQGQPPAPVPAQPPAQGTPPPPPPGSRAPFAPGTPTSGPGVPPPPAPGSTAPPAHGTPPPSGPGARP